VALPTPSMVRYGGNSNAHWVRVFVEAQGGSRGLPDGKLRVLEHCPPKMLDFGPVLLLKVEIINH